MINNLELRDELETLLEREVGFTGKFILQKQCQHLNIDPDMINTDCLPQLSNQIHWAIKSFTGDKKADDIKKGILQYKNALDMVNNAVEKQQDDPRDSIKAQITIGAAKIQIGKIDESIEAYREALVIYDKNHIDDKILKAMITRKLARALTNNKEGREEARSLYNDVIDMKLGSNGLYDKALAWNGLGIISWREGEHSTSLDHYMEAIKVITSISTASKNDKKKKDRAMARIHTGLGNTCLDLLNMEMSIYHNKKAIELYTSLEDHSGIGLTYNNMARVYEEMGNFSKAIDGYEKGIKYCREGGSLRMEGWTMTNLASALIENRRAEDALPHLDRASKILANFNDPIAHSKLHCMYGKHYSAVENYQESEMHFQKSIDFVINENSPDYLAITREEMGKMYHKKGDMAKAEDVLIDALDWYVVKKEDARIKNIQKMLGKN